MHLLSFGLILSMFAALTALYSHANEKEIDLALFRSVSAEMERLDGAALLVRENRPEHWTQTLARLELELSAATDQAEVTRVFRRLDATYPSRHTSVKFGEDLALYQTPRIRAAVGFDADWLARYDVRFRIVRVDASLTQKGVRRPRIGDQLIAINGRPLTDWRRENFLFCKFAQRDACDFTFPSRLLSGILGWSYHDPLTYTLQRNGKRWTLTIPVETAPQRSHKSTWECAQEPDRYTGFRLRYAGNRACVFQSVTDPRTALLRITSFGYGPDHPDENQTIRSIQDETLALGIWWQKNATWSHLIIDVTDNPGGSPPIDYYRLLLTKNFQEQYVKFRKTPEIIDRRLRMHPRGFFWGSPGHELWWQNLQSSVIWDYTRTGEFLPAVPQFCADEAMDCSQGVFAPEEHPFQGHVSVLLNSFCASACDGFVWQLKSKMRNRVRFFGHPNAGDPGFARLDIRVYRDPKLPLGFRTVIGPHDSHLDKNNQDPSLPQPWLVQTIYATQTVSISGELLDGQSMRLTSFVPWRSENADQWVNDALKHALASENQTNSF